jgi:GNAT superfamily N-acetyltransferase
MSSSRGDEAQNSSTESALAGDQSLLTSAATIIRPRSQDVGHVVVTLCFSMEYGGLIAFVDDLFVQKPFRRAGVGAAALEEVKDFCASHGVRALLPARLFSVGMLLLPVFSSRRSVRTDAGSRRAIGKVRESKYGSSIPSGSSARCRLLPLPGSPLARTSDGFSPLAPVIMNCGKRGPGNTNTG